MLHIERQTILPREVIPQPEPRLWERGDCGACVLGGLLKLTVAEAYERLAPDGKVAPLCYYDMIDALNKAEGLQLADSIITSVPLWPVPTVHKAWGWRNQDMAIDWYNYIRLAVEAKHYAICLVDYREGGPIGLGTNHWVIIRGVRENHVTQYSDTHEPITRIYQEVLVNCSAKKTSEWMDCIDFLTNMGGYNALLVRPCP